MRLRTIRTGLQTVRFHQGTKPIDEHNTSNHSATWCNRAGTFQRGTTRCNAVQVGLQNITEKFSPAPPTEKCETALLTACESSQVPRLPSGFERSVGECAHRGGLDSTGMAGKCDAVSAVPQAKLSPPHAGGVSPPADDGAAHTAHKRRFSIR